MWDFLYYIILFLIALKAIKALRKLFLRPSFKHQTVLITGGSSGIGEALAKQFIQAGAQVIIAARNLTELNRVKSECSIPENVQVLKLDITDFTNTIKQIRELNQEIDILINNAGTSVRMNVVDQLDNMEVEKKILDINTLGHIAPVKAVLPYMIKRKSGHIITISSVAGLMGAPLRAPYCASKFGITGYYESLRTELAQYNIAVQVISPGFVQTNISKNSLTADGSTFGKMDPANAGGMTSEKFARKALKAIYLQEYDTVIASPFVHAALLLRWLSPSIFNWVMSRVARKFSENLKKAK